MNNQNIHPVASDFFDGVRFYFRDGTKDKINIQRIFLGNAYGFPNNMKGETFIDIGGHIGESAVCANKRGATVISYEPSADNFMLMKKTFSENNLPITAVNKGVGEHGTATLYISRDNSGENTTFDSLDGFIRSGSEVVELITLDEILSKVSEDNGCILKCDCEGGEISVIREILGGLYRKVRTIFMEFHFPFDADLEALSKYYSYIRTNIGNPEYRFERK